MSVQASYQPMSILTERKGRAGLNVPSRTQKEKRLNEKIWKKERMMNMNESTAGIFRRQRQLVVAVLTATTEHCQPHHDRGFRLPDGR